MLLDSKKDGKMDYKKPWHVLDIDISNAVREDFDFQNLYSESEFYGKPVGIWNFMNHTVDQLLSQKWIDYMHSIGLPVKSAIVFFREPYYIHPGAHVDVFWDGRIVTGALNWVVDPMDDSEMIWYDMPLDSGQFLLTPAETKYLNWDLPSVENHVLDRRCIAKHPTLVNVGIPHNIIVKSRSRWAISVRLESGVVDSWQEMVDFFSPFIKD
jgi:hypothetical protein